MSRRKDKLNGKKTGQDFEDQVRKSINSGTLRTDPLDLSTKNYCIECKTVKDKQKSYRVDLETLEKTWKRALDIGKKPVLIIGIPRNENEMFILNCEVTIQKRRGH